MLGSTEIRASDAEIEQAARVFDREHALHLPGFLDGAFIQFVQQHIDRDGFHARVHDTLPDRPVDLVLNPSLAMGTLLLAVNDAPFVSLVRRITRRPDIRSFGGAIQRRVPGAGHDDVWHDDFSDGRIAVLSINLGAKPYFGGELQIRQGADGPIVYSRSNTEPGDALLFRIDRSLKHRVTRLVREVPRTVLAGWFRSEPVQNIFGLHRS